MKITLVNVVMVSAGGILLYSGLKAYDPRDVIKWGLGGKKPKSFKGDGKKQEPKVNPDDHPGDMPDTYPDKDGDGWPDGRVVSV